MADNKWNEELNAKIIARAWKDENFRKLLLNNPKEALKEYNIEIPENIEMKVLSEDANHIYFVLPQSPSELKALSSEELVQLAAGFKTWIFNHTCHSLC